MFRILLLGDSRSFHLERYQIELKRQSCEVLFLSLESGEVPHVSLRRKGPFKFLHYTLAASELKRVIAEYKPDVVDAHYASGYGHLATKALSNSNIPLTVHLWGSDILVVPHKSWLHKRKVVTALSNADVVIGDSDYLLAAAKKIHHSKEAINIQFGIEERFLRLHKKNHEYSSPLKVIVPRPHEPVYNNRFILSAACELLKENRITISFSNFGSNLADFKSELRRLGCSNVILYDKKNREEFLKYMSGHEVYLSAAKSDSSPVSLIEAMALGLIPVAAEIPGVSEWLTEKSGFSYQENNEQALQGILSRIVSGQNRFEQMRRDNLAKVKERAIFERNVADRIAIMRRLADKNVD
jgi:glycosyltransferase involved in cell wall biosynthesis